MKNIVCILLLGLFLQGCANFAKKQAVTKTESDTAVKSLEEQSNYLSGTYTSDDNSFYKSLTFKGKSTVVIKDAFIGMSFPTSYERDENFIRIKTDKSDLLFEIKDEKTLVGEGFAEGCFVKE